MEKLYSCRCSSCRELNNKADQDFNLTDEELNYILHLVFDRDFDTLNDIERTLFNHTRTFLDQAVDKAFKLTVEENKEFIEQLKYNNAVFAAFKTHRQQNDLAALLIDEEGRPRSFDAFRKAADPVIGAYNNTWLQTEYNAAVKSARTAEIFLRYQKDKDIYPNVKWLPSVSPDPRISHMVYYNQVRSVDDPWWKNHYPGCVWNCKCDSRATKEAITHVGDSPVAESVPDTVSPGLDRNPAFSKAIFSDTHPYIAEADKTAKNAVKRFLGKETENGTE